MRTERSEDAESRLARPHPGRWAVSSGAGSLGLLLLVPGLLAGQLSTHISGRILDQETKGGVPEAEIRLLGTRWYAVSGQDGAFRFEGVGPGRYLMEIRHLAYGVHAEGIVVDGEKPLFLQIGISPEAIEMDPLRVRIDRVRDLPMRASGTSIAGVSRVALDVSDLRGLKLGQVLEQHIPGVQVRESSAMVGFPTCVEFRGARFGQYDGSCRSPAVYLDGIRVSNPEDLYGSLDMGDIERMEMLPPAEAGVRFGTGALWGALVIETMIPGLRPAEREGFRIGPLSLSAYDWSQESGPNSWWKVYASAFVGNAIGLGMGVPLAGRCIEVAPPNFDRVTSECSGFPTTVSALAGLAFPAIGSTVGAQLGGRTSLSRGEFVPLAISAVMVLVPGYALEVSSRRSGRGGTSAVAKVVLAFGVPAIVTFSDRLFRKLRPGSALE